MASILKGVLAAFMLVGSVYFMREVYPFTADALSHIYEIITFQYQLEPIEISYVVKLFSWSVIQFVLLCFMPTKSDLTEG